jgi:hypothetical protein
MEIVMKIILVLIAAISFITAPAFTQEIECNLNLDLQALTTSEARENINDFGAQLKDYINSYRWTSEDYGTEKVKCSITISFQGVNGNNHYIAQVIVGSQRPVLNSDHNTPVIRLRDDNWEFDYIHNQSLQHITSRFDPLLSFIDYYMYLILGYDADTYTLSGGTPYFQKAQDIVNMARGAGATSPGWEQKQQTLYSRAQLVDELLNPKFHDFRKAVFYYHYRGLDSLYKSSSTKPYKRILSSLNSIKNLSEKINQSTLIFKTFFDTKYLEIAETFLKYNDAETFTKLVSIDPAHQKTYEEYAEKLK